MIDPPHLVPRAVAFRVVAHVLAGEAFIREKRADPSSHRRAGRAAAEAFARDKEAGRLAGAEERRRGAGLLFDLANHKANGPGVDAAVMGHLVAWLCGRAESWREMAAEAHEWLGRELLPPRAGDLKYAGDWPLQAFICRLVICADDGVRSEGPDVE
ncbi:MAG: hypothetical protein E6G97_18420 [Alphaproteobacteria bacterium]|nr:MAG: hypothetical protein E6G97_18420 [Alphaproteobacteria bacterium]